MRLTIDINEEQAGYLRRQLGKTRDGGTGFDIILMLAHALPRSLRIGDTVRWMDTGGWYEVVAIHGRFAWLFRDGFEPATRPIAELRHAEISS